MKIATFASRLVERMTELNITAAELSRRTKISEAVISQYKSGLYEPKQDRLEEFAKQLDVSAQWLRGYDVSKNRLTINKVLSRRGTELNLSADNLAKKLGIDRSTVFRYEEKSTIEKIPSEIIKNAAEIPHTTPQHLMGLEENSEWDENPWELELLESFDKMKIDDQIYFTDLAKYFSICPDEVKIIIAQKVGKSSPTAEGDETARELYEIIGSLDPESRQKALDYLKYLSDTSKK